VSITILITKAPFSSEKVVKVMNDAWIGVEITLSRNEESQFQNSDFVCVNAHRAITCLAEKSPEIAQRWMNCTTFRGTKFLFGKECFRTTGQQQLF
jgi:hypothetical protein